MTKLTPKRVVLTLRRSHLPLERVQNLRTYRGGRQQTTAALLRLMVVAFACGKRTLRAAEALSEDIPSRMRRALGCRRVNKVSDTALYDALHRTLPWPFRPVVVSQVKAELERKGIQNDAFAIGVCAYDGKKVAFGHGRRPCPECLTTFTTDGRKAWMLKSLRSCLVSSSVRPVLGQHWLPHEYGEATAFPDRFKADVEAFPRLFRIVTGDAGITSKANAALVRTYGKHYLFAVKLNHRSLFHHGQGLLHDAPVVARTVERTRGCLDVRELARASLSEPIGVKDAAQFVSVRHRGVGPKGKPFDETRIFVTSIPTEELSADKLLKLVRLHWQIENGPNWTSDLQLDEDLACPCYQGAGPVVVSWLRILAYNLMAVFRTHLPMDGQRPTAWRRVKELIYQMLLCWTPDNELLCALA